MRDQHEYAVAIEDIKTRRKVNYLGKINMCKTRAKKLPSVSELLEFVKYDPKSPSGLTWIKTKSNRIKIGNVAGTKTLSGHWSVHMYGVRMLTHRIVYKIKTGEDPDIIDHIDGNPSNNRIRNLRSVTKSMNSMNRCIDTNNRSGIRGVHWSNLRTRWVAEIKYLGKRKFIGSFTNVATAEQALLRYKAKLGILSFAELLKRQSTKSSRRVS